MGLEIQTIEAAMATGIRRRSSLMIWMITHHDEFARLIQINGADWPGLAKYFADAGMLSRVGQPLTPRTVETYWFRAKRTVQKQRASQHRTIKPPAYAPATQSAVTDTPAEPRFKPVRAHDEHLWLHSPIEPTKPGAPSPAKKSHPVNPAYAGLTPEQIADKILGRTPKDKS